MPLPCELLLRAPGAPASRIGRTPDVDTILIECRFYAYYFADLSTRGENCSHSVPAGR